MLHAWVMGNGRTVVKPTLYRDAQNIIKDGMTSTIVYLPPEAHDVPELMRQLVAWIKENKQLPCPIVAAIVHYQFATIHPYFDGNGRTARLLTTLLLHLEGYDLKGLYSLEEYYAKNLPAYYRVISVGPSHIITLVEQKATLLAGLIIFATVWLIHFKRLWNIWRHCKKREEAKITAPCFARLIPKSAKYWSFLKIMRL